MGKLTNEQLLLLEIAKGDMSYKGLIIDRKLIENIDWEELLNLSKRHSVFPIVYKFLKGYIPDDCIVKYVYEYHSFVRKIDLFIKELEKISEIAHRHNIEIVLVKGLALSKLIYGDLYLRQCGDIDILVHESDMVRMDKLMRERGYFQEYGYDEVNKKFKVLPGPIYKFHYKFFEFQYLKEIGDNKYMQVEIKRATSAIPQKYINRFLEETQKIRMNNLFINTNNILYTFLHLCANTYGDSEKPSIKICLRDYVDLHTFISKYKDDMNWNEIHELSNDYEMLHKLYCVFINLDNIYDGFLSNKIIELFNPKYATYEHNSRCENGSMVKWKSNFINRLFDYHECINEFTSLFKQRQYSSDNKNYRIPYVLSEYSQCDLQDLNNYINFVDEKYSRNTGYLFSYDKYRLYFAVCLDNFFLNNLEDTNITLGIMGNDSKSESPTLP